MTTFDTDFTAEGPALQGFSTFFIVPPEFDYGFAGHGVFAGAFGRAGGDLGPRPNNVFLGVAGVIGESRDFPGAAGSSTHNIGVYGQTEEVAAVPSLVGGVYGTGNTRPGVIGSSSQSFGVQGVSFLGTGVRGTSFRGAGMQGQSGLASGVIGVSGTQGPPVPGLPLTAGVLGSSADRPGVIGTSNTHAGVHAFSNNVGIVGETSNDASFAGIFLGNVAVTRNLTVSGTKSAAVPFPDGTQRVLYCMESPELWFEDFGTAKLKRGRAVVKLDADFAKVITRGDYRVFLTPEGDCRGLYVRGKSAASFEVRELMGGKSSIARADEGGAARIRRPPGEGGGGAQTEGREESQKITRVAASQPARRSPRSAGAQTEGCEDRQRMTRALAGHLRSAIGPPPPRRRT